MVTLIFSFSNSLTFPGEERDKSGLQDIGQSANDECISGIVFVVRRMAAVALHHYLQQLISYDEELRFVRSGYVVGKRSYVAH